MSNLSGGGTGGRVVLTAPLPAAPLFEERRDAYRDSRALQAARDGPETIEGQCAVSSGRVLECSTPPARRMRLRTSPCLESSLKIRLVEQEAKNLNPEI